VESERIDAVLNLAAGLDTRPYRMQLPPDLHWIDADLPGIMAHRKEGLSDAKPCCRVASLSIDLQDASARCSFLAALAGRHKRILVVTEALLAYLQPSTVVDLAIDLGAHAAFRAWLCDTTTPALAARLLRSWGPVLTQGGASFAFTPDAGPHFFESHGWKVAGVRSLVEEAVRMRRLPPLLRIAVAFLPLAPKARRDEVRTGSVIALLERGERGAGR
jgi:O-methyltransferase involved in polyketide biosynthesis